MDLSMLDDLVSTILVVDDDEVNLELAEMIIDAKLGYNVLRASSGRQALEVLTQNKVDLILLDVMMPGLDGMQTLQMIRDNPKTKDIPVILLTAAGDVMTVVKGSKLGIKDYIKKPFDSDDLVDRILKVIGFEMLDNLDL